MHLCRKKNCCNVLAVEYTNGKPYGDAYKLPDLSKLTKRKNHNKISGKKRTGQPGNSVEIDTVTRVRVLRSNSDSNTVK